MQMPPPPTAAAATRGTTTFCITQIAPAPVPHTAPSSPPVPPSCLLPRPLHSFGARCMAKMFWLPAHLLVTPRNMVKYE